MRIVLVGADYEENLGLEMIAASLREASHEVRFVPFHDASEVEGVADRILAVRPGLVGLAIQFQHRCHDFLLLARRLRGLGFDGHITAGGQHSTMAFKEILASEPALDSVVLHEGERTVVELCAVMGSGTRLELVPGLAVRNDSGRPQRTASRPLSANLDELPFAHRWRAPSRHLGIPFIPVSGSRGCWGSCSFCGISAYYRDAVVQAGQAGHASARRLRLRSPENLAREMAALWHAQGGPTIFCFHDDTLLLPRPAKTLERLRAVRSALDELGVGEVAIIGKTRPDCVTAELARELRQLGVIRMFVGIENGSQPGQDHLGRRTQTEDLHRALDAFEEAGIFVCYNLLLFEPQGSLDDIRENIAFIRRHPSIPLNFCRAEPYHGTPLFHQLRDRGSLLGSHLGWDYRIDDNRTELLFRVCDAAFRERNFSAAGLSNRTMGLGYTAQILRCLHDGSSNRAKKVLARVNQLVRDVTNDTAELLEDALTLVSSVELCDGERIARETALLGLRVSAHDRVWLALVDALTRELEDCVAAEKQPVRRPGVPGRLRDVAAQLAVAGCLAASLPVCGGRTEDGGGGEPVDPETGGHAGVAGMTGDGGAPSGGWAGDGGAPSGGMSGDGGAPSGGWIGDGGAPSGGMTGDGGAPSGGWTSDGGAPSGGWTSDGGAPSGGWTSDGGAPSGGWTSDGGAPSGGWVGDGGAPSGGMTGDGGAPSGGWTSDGGAPSGGWTSDGGAPSGGWEGDGGAPSGGMAGDGGAPSGGMAGDGGAPSGGMSGDGGAPPGGFGAAGDGEDTEVACADGVDNDGDSFIDCDDWDCFAACARGSDANLSPDGAGGSDADRSPNGSGERDPSKHRTIRALKRTGSMVEHWRSTSPRRVVRSTDLPLADPPVITLQAQAEGDIVRVFVSTQATKVRLRWEGDGRIEGDGRLVHWYPKSPEDQLRVAVYSEGGVAIATLRAGRG